MLDAVVIAFTLRTKQMCLRLYESNPATRPENPAMLNVCNCDPELHDSAPLRLLESEVNLIHS